jgi:integrase
MTGPDLTPAKRTPAKHKARQLAKHLRSERPDYAYLKEVFRHLRDELDVQVTRQPKKLPHVPTEAEIRRYYHTVWTARRSGDIVLIKTLLYTGVRVAELVKIALGDVDLDTCRIRITQGKGDKDRYVPFPAPFKETLALHIDAMRGKNATFLFESSWSHTPPAGYGPCSPARRAEQTVGGKLRAWLVCESSTGELLVEHPDADQHRRHGPRPPTLTSQLSTASHGLFRSPLRGSGELFRLRADLRHQAQTPAV